MIDEHDDKGLEYLRRWLKFWGLVDPTTPAETLLPKTTCATHEHVELEVSILAKTFGRVGITAEDIRRVEFYISAKFSCTEKKKEHYYCPVVGCKGARSKFKGLYEHAKEKVKSEKKEIGHRAVEMMTSKKCPECGADNPSFGTVLDHLRDLHPQKCDKYLKGWLEDFGLPRGMYIPPARTSFLCLLAFQLHPISLPP
jgi:hypothetical protein